MKTYDLSLVVEKIRERVEAHRLAPGSYARYLWQNPQNTRNLGEEPYGCADAVNILYSIADFPRDLEERAACVAHLQGLQGEDGFYRSVDHHHFHTTAHCAAALELFDAAPRLRPEALRGLLEPGRVEDFLWHLDWEHDPWDQSHIGAGLFVCLNLTEMADLTWNERYFKWLWDNADPVTGFWRGPLERMSPQASRFHYLAGTFHYLFNLEYAHKPLRFPEKVIDTCLDIYDRELAERNFGGGVGFSAIDWIFCVTRASRQTAYRFEDARKRLEKVGENAAEWWLHVDWEKHDALNDMHCLFGGVCALAELQQTLRGKILTPKPLRLVLDRRPFI